jgi:zinc transport system substrate-binding protein
VEAHHFEPRPADIALLNNADIFIYTGDFMETWARDTIKGLDNPELIIVRAADNTKVLGEIGTPYSDMGHIDPHVWLDFDNTKIMASNIAQALRNRAPDQVANINERLNIINDKLDAINKNYSERLSKCANHTIIFAGHYTFGYLANKYSLTYKAAQGLSPDKEPTAEEMIALIEQIKRDNIKYVFYEELTSPKIAETLARETGAQLLELNSAHNLTKSQINNGQNFFTAMTNNLNNLIMGLDCQ